MKRIVSVEHGARDMSYKLRGVALPENLKSSLDAYAEFGRPTGGFLEACLSNDLRAAVSLADKSSIRALPVIVGYLYNELPCGCWGSKAAVDKWLVKKAQERRNA